MDSASSKSSECCFDLYRLCSSAHPLQCFSSPLCRQSVWLLLQDFSLLLLFFFFFPILLLLPLGFCCWFSLPARHTGLQGWGETERTRGCRAHPWVSFGVLGLLCGAGTDGEAAPSGLPLPMQPPLPPSVPRPPPGVCAPTCCGATLGAEAAAEHPALPGLEKENPIGLISFPLPQQQPWWCVLVCSQAFCASSYGR